MTSPALISLSTPSSSAAIAPMGAEPRSWKVDGSELLWSADPAFWPQVSPILFPVVGWTRNGEMRIKGKRYPLGLHGFAARHEFELLGQSAAEASLRLVDDEVTRALYPFAFELIVAYSLSETSFAATFRVTNPGHEPMPYALGLHPGFAWPLPGPRASSPLLSTSGADPRAGSPRHAATADRHAVVFASEVSASIPVIAPGGLISARRRDVPLERGRALRLSPGLFAHEALCFLDAASTRLVFLNGEGQGIEVENDGFAHIALWTKPGASYLCIESWSGYGDPEGFEGDIFDKPSMRVLAPGEAATHRVSWTWRRGGDVEALGDPLTEGLF